MSINLGNLELTLIQKIDSSSSPSEIQTYTKALEYLRAGISYAVNEYSNLPIITIENAGSMYYVESENSFYISNFNENVWASLPYVSYTAYGWGNNDYCRIALIDGIYPIPCIEQSGSVNWCCVQPGDLHTTGFKRDGTIWSWGYSAYGQIGGTALGVTPSQEFRKASWFSVSVQSCGVNAIKTDGSIWGWGRNTCGYIGNNSTLTVNSPVQEISSSNNWSYIFQSGFLSLGYDAIKTDGTLWGWGYNLWGRLGDDTLISRSSPVQEITSSTNWCYASSGTHARTAIKTDGTLWSSGFNSSGQLGTNNTVCYSSPVQEISSSTDWCTTSTGFCTTVALKTDGTIWGWGRSLLAGVCICNAIDFNSSPLQEITSSTNWCCAFTNYTLTNAIKTDGTLWQWGTGGSTILQNGLYAALSSPTQEFTSKTDWTYANAGTAHAYGVRAIGN